MVGGRDEESNSNNSWKERRRGSRNSSWEGPRKGFRKGIIKNSMERSRWAPGTCLVHQATGTGVGRGVRKEYQGGSRKGSR